ncbi:MAG: DUF6491 family protein [Pseudomonadales bacterium]
MKLQGTNGRYLAAMLLTGVLAAPGALATLPEGVPVRSIENADDISGWSHIDNQRVLLSLNETNTYLLTLKHQCHGLAWAQNVTVTMSNNTIWAGFDEIQADGLACPIHSIQKLDPKDL